MLSLLAWVFKFVTLLIGAVFTICVVLNIVMYAQSRNHNMQVQKEYAVVFGASVHGFTLSSALRARVETAIQLYQKGLVKNILLSGDGADGFYSETNAMKRFALKEGVPEAVLLTDEKGYNTYATVFRAKNVFHVQSAYMVSQDFHLTRAVWLARKVGIDADGVSAGSMDKRWYYDVREFLARVKDFGQLIFY